MSIKWLGFLMYILYRQQITSLLWLLLFLFFLLPSFVFLPESQFCFPDSYQNWLKENGFLTVWVREKKKKLVIFSLLCSSVTVCRKDKAIWERCMCIWRFSARKLTRTVRSVFHESRAVFCARISAYLTSACNFLQKI